MSVGVKMGAGVGEGDFGDVVFDVVFKEVNF